MVTGDRCFPPRRGGEKEEEGLAVIAELRSEIESDSLELIYRGDPGDGKHSVGRCFNGKRLLGG